MAAADPTQASSPTLGRRERKKRETRARILGSAAELFTDRGFDATTIEEIAEAADVSRATFFKYFSEKSALIAELGDAMADGFVASADAATSSDGPIAARLSELFDDSTRRLEARSDLNRALVFETVGRRRDLAERRSQTVRLHRAIESLLRDGVERGEVRSDVPVSLLAEMVAGAYLEILLTWVVDPEVQLGARLRLAVQVLGSAIAPTEGAANGAG